MSLDVEDALEKLQDAIYRWEDLPVAFVLGPPLYQEVVAVAETHRQSDPEELYTAQGIETRYDEHLQGPGIKGLGLVFYDWEELKEYFDLPPDLRVQYAITPPGETVSRGVFIHERTRNAEQLIPKEELMVKGNTKTLMWTDEED